MGTATPIQVLDSVTGALVPNIGDTANNALRVNVVAGGGGGGGNVVITGPLGQSLMAASVAVTIASDQTALASNITKVGGTALALGSALSAASIPVVIASDQVAVNVKQGTASNLKAQVVGAGTAGSADAGVLTVQGIASMTALQVDGSAVTQPISAVSLPLPSGAATAIKQPALGTAGTASADVITVQGIASMTALKVDGTGGTFPVSGTVTAQQTTASNLKAQVTGGGTAGSADTGVVTIQGIASGTAVTISGTVTANAGTGTGDVNLKQVGGATVALGQTTMSASIPVTLASNQAVVATLISPQTSGGLTIYRNLNLGTSGVSVKGLAGMVYGWVVVNDTASATFLKLYNSSGAPTVGSDTPVMTIQIPANSTGQYSNSVGITFSSGIGVGGTGLIADADTTAPGTNGVCVNIFYK